MYLAGHGPGDDDVAASIKKNDYLTIVILFFTAMVNVTAVFDAELNNINESGGG